MKFRLLMNIERPLYEFLTAGHMKSVSDARRDNYLTSTDVVTRHRDPLSDVYRSAGEACLQAPSRSGWSSCADTSRKT